MEPTVRLWFKDGNYMDVPEGSESVWESDPAWERTEMLESVEDEPGSGDQVPEVQPPGS